MMNGRFGAYQVLRRTGEEYSNLLLREILPEVSEKDRGLCSYLVYGVLANRTRLDYAISHFCDFDKPSEELKNILRIGAYQILFSDKIPVSAAVDESVKLAKEYFPYASGFVNGVLRKISKEEVPLPPADDFVKYLKIKYSYPKSIIKKWISMFGKEETEALMKAMNEPSGVYLRVNTLKASPDDVLEETGGELVLRSLIKADKGFSVEGSSLYSEGKITVMQKSSYMAVESMGVKPGMRVLDMCAAPGGKTLFMAELMENKGEITAWDIHKHRVDLIEKNAQRMGVNIVKASERDGCEFVPSLEESFDAVLLDAPCSGFGVISSKPDIKWRGREGNLPQIQQKLIENASRYVKRDGILLYCTCTINDEENEKIVQTLDKDKFHVEFIKTYLPHRDNTNGFFVSKILKG